MTRPTSTMGMVGRKRNIIMGSMVNIWTKASKTTPTLIHFLTRTSTIFRTSRLKNMGNMINTRGTMLKSMSLRKPTNKKHTKNMTGTIRTKKSTVISTTTIKNMTNMITIKKTNPESLKTMNLMINSKTIIPMKSPKKKESKVIPTKGNSPEKVKNSKNSTSTSSANPNSKISRTPLRSLNSARTTTNLKITKNSTVLPRYQL